MGMGIGQSGQQGGLSRTLITALVVALLGMVALGGGYYVANNIIPTHVRDTGQPANLDFANCSDGYTLRVSGTTITAGSLQDDGDGEIIIRGDDPRIGTPGAAWQGDQGDFIIGSAGNIAIGSAQAHVQLLAGSAVVVSDESCLGDGIIEPAPGKRIICETLMPVGTVLPFAGDNAPTGFVLCDGALYDKVGTMAALYAVIGNTYGEAGGQFNVPDLRNRFPVGAGDAYSRGETGGSATTILDVTSLPAHSHDVTDPGHTHAGSGGSFVIETEGSAYDHAEGDVGSSAAETEQAQTGITIEETGDGAPFDTMPPYVGLNYIIRY